MTRIPSFGQSLLANPPQGQSVQSVEDILNNTPPAESLPEQQADNFTYQNAPQQRNSGSPLIIFGASLVGAAGLFLAGRQGAFGKHVQKWFGGSPSLKKLQKIMQGKMSEYLGKDGKIKTCEFGTSADGKNQILKAEFENGEVREYIVRKGNKHISMAGVRSDGKQEVILFGRQDGMPVMKTVIKKDSKGNIIGYEKFKGGSVIDKDFEEVSDMLYQKNKTSESSFFGRKRKNITSKKYDNPDTCSPSVTETKVKYNKYGNVTSVKTKTPDGNIKITKLGSDGRPDKVVIIDKEGKKAIHEYLYTVGSDGSRKLKDISSKIDEGNNFTRWYNRIVY